MLSAIQASVEFIECERAIEVNRFYVAPTPQAARRSKWNFVFVRLGSRSGFRRRNRFANAPSAITLIAAISSTTTARTSQHLHRFADYLQLAPLLSRLFVVPGIKLQPAFDKNRTSFFQVLARHFRCSSPKSDVHKGDLLTFLPALQRVLPIDRNPKIRHRASLWSVTHLRVAGQISKQNDFIKTCHALFYRTYYSAATFFDGFLTFSLFTFNR